MSLILLQKFVKLKKLNIVQLKQINMTKCSNLTVDTTLNI